LPAWRLSSTQSRKCVPLTIDDIIRVIPALGVVIQVIGMTVSWLKTLSKFFGIGDVETVLNFSLPVKQDVADSTGYAIRQVI